jgi:hypothetical protein
MGSPVSTRHSTITPTLRGGFRRFADLADWRVVVPLVFGLAYLVAVLAQFTQIVAVTYLNGDAASAPVIGELFGGSPAHREVVLGKMAWFSTLLFELATRWLPLHRQIWETTPYVLALLSAGLLAWGVWQLAGRWAATITGVVALTASPATLSWLFSLNDHSPDWFCNALLASLLVLIGGSETRGGSRPLIAVALAIGVIVGVNLASDPLLAVGGVLPFLLAAMVTWGRRSGRPRTQGLLLAGGSLAAMVSVDALTRLLMQHEIVVGSSVQNNGTLAGTEQITNNFRFWWQSIAVLGDGNFFGQTSSFTSVLELICAALSIAVVVVIAPRIAWREVSRAFGRGALGDHTQDPSSRAQVANTSGAPGLARNAKPPKCVIGDDRRVAWCAFWGLSLVFLSLAFVVSSVPVEIYDDRYLVGLIYAAAALLPLWATHSVRRQAAVVAGTSVFAFTGILGLLEGHATENTAHWPAGHLDGQVMAIARREHLQIGYAGYWDAATITWGTHLAVKIFPLATCGNQYCLFYEHYISSWYTPRPGIRTFLLSDSAVALATPYLSALGKPSAVYSIGQLTMYVFPYDIAGRVRK